MAADLHFLIIELFSLEFTKYNFSTNYFLHIILEMLEGPLKVILISSCAAIPVGIVLISDMESTHHLFEYYHSEIKTYNRKNIGLKNKKLC